MLYFAATAAEADSDYEHESDESVLMIQALDAKTAGISHVSDFACMQPPSCLLNACAVGLGPRLAPLTRVVGGVPALSESLSVSPCTAPKQRACTPLDIPPL